MDWRETVKEAKAKGVPDIDKEIQGFLKNWYDGGNDQARKHRVAIQSYKRVTDRSQNCR